MLCDSAFVKQCTSFGRCRQTVNRVSDMDGIEFDHYLAPVGEGHRLSVSGTPTEPYTHIARTRAKFLQIKHFNTNTDQLGQRRTHMASTQHKITVNAPAAKIFNAISTIEGLKGWYTPTIEGNTAKGQEATFLFSGKKSFRWKFVEIKPFTHVKWECLEGPGAARGTSVSFSIEEKGPHQASVDCDHDNWPDGHGAIKTCNTLWGILMGHLKQYAESGHPDPAFS